MTPAQTLNRLSPVARIWLRRWAEGGVPWTKVHPACRRALKNQGIAAQNHITDKWELTERGQAVLDLMNGKDQENE